MNLNVEYLPYGENAVNLIRQLPVDLPTTTAAKIKVDDLNDNALTTEQSASVYTAAVTTGAIARLANTCTLTGSPTAPTVGQVYRIQKTGEQYDDMRVRAYDAATKIVTFYNRFKYAHATGAAFTARFVTYALDCSTTTTYTDTLECLIRWYGFDGDDRVLTNVVRVRKHWADFGDLRAEFAKIYGRYEELIPEGAWQALVGAGRREWRRMLGRHGHDFDFIVDTYRDVAADGLMVAIALQLAMGFGDAWAQERKLLHERKAELFDQMRKLMIWDDADDDGIRDDEEYQRPERPYPRRRL